MVDRYQRLRFENLLPIRTRDSQSLLHVRLSLVEGERMGLGPQRQTLPQLAQMRLFQLLLQLRLSHQHDLNQLFAISLEIR